MWEQTTSRFPGGPAYGINSTTTMLGNGTSTGDEAFYSGYLFTQKTVAYIDAHAKAGHAGPMFMYVALQNTHAPVQAPQRTIDTYMAADASDLKKAVFSAQVSYVDETVANITAALEANQMWARTLLVWSTDNGSPVQVAGSNHPLKGGKGHNWEGGVRTPTFVAGGALPASMHGKELTGLVSIADWYATFSSIAGLGGSADPSLKPGPAVAESLDQSGYIFGSVTVPPRSVLVHDHRMFSNASEVNECAGQDTWEWAYPGRKECPGARCASLGAIRVGAYKLIVGRELEASWFGMFSPNTTGVSPDLTATACEAQPCLYNIETDPGNKGDTLLVLWTFLRCISHEIVPTE
eukprot:SAG22_NODE_639_length_8255_cov_13.659882_6_plen_351_part_00